MAYDTACQVDNSFIFGSIMYPNEVYELEYIDAYKKALGDTNIIVDSNI